MQGGQQQQQLHRAVIDGIAHLSDPRNNGLRLWVSGYKMPEAVDRDSIQHLVDFLDNSGREGGGQSSHEVVITELYLESIHLPGPHDGGLQVLCAFFSRSDMTVMKVTIEDCDFGTAQDASQLLTAFETNGTVQDLTIRRIHNLESAGLGACLSSLMRNMLQLQQLDCAYSTLRVEGIRALQPGLQSNQTLRELNLTACHIGDEGILLVADALVGNTIMELLDISWNDFTSDGLDDITRILESTSLQKIGLRWNDMAFRNEASTQGFARVLSRHEFLNELNLCDCRLGDGAIRIIVDCLVGNTVMESLSIQYNGFTPVGLDDITRLVESTRLKAINLAGNDAFGNEASTQRFARVLSRQVFLKELNLSDCELGNGSIRIIAQGLVGNTVMESLYISLNSFTCDGLDDIAKLVVSTHLKKISFYINNDVFSNAEATQRQHNSTGNDE